MTDKEKTSGPQEESALRNDDMGDDSNWEGTNTTFTGSTSEAGFSFILKQENNHIKNFTSRLSRNCSKYAGCLLAGIISIVSFLSPLLMIILPKIEFNEWKTEECSSGCEGLLISLCFKLLILLIGSWALFWRKPQVNMPRVFAFRAVVLALLFVLSSIFWLFYGVTIIAAKNPNYQSIVGFASSMVDCLLFVNYLAVILLEIRHLRARYIVKIVRSPDGSSSCFTVGHLSIQRLATYCLDRYHCDFDSFNPYLDRMLNHRSKTRVSKTAEFKIYNIDSDAKGGAGISKSPSMIRSRGKESTGHNERFYQEEAYERKVRKRRARLVCAAEESFANIRHLQADKENGIQLTPHDAAQAIFAGLVNPLQKYLRVTRQQPKYSIDSIIDHVMQCFLFNLSAKTFVEKYLTQGRVISNESRSQDWVIVSQLNPNRGIEHGTVFCLKKGDISLMINVSSLPHYNLTEDDHSIPSVHKFMITEGAETPV